MNRDKNRKILKRAVIIGIICACVTAVIVYYLIDNDVARAISLGVLSSVIASALSMILPMHTAAGTWRFVS